MEKVLLISIVILTYNRKSLLRTLLISLSQIKYKPLEIIVVDNHSEEPIGDMILSEFPQVVLLEMEENIGIAARNKGISYASGNIIITLDDDIIGIDDNAINNLIYLFSKAEIGAICFKVVDTDNRMTNWCHHYDVEKFSEQIFITNEITEGAVAFRKETLKLSGYYPETFFVSHEGPDLAYRIMNKGYNVIYSPEITVKHYHSKMGRKHWRRYYFDTRNLFWLVVRTHPFIHGAKTLFIGVAAMLIYSIRDGFLRYWIKGVIDGILGLRQAYIERCKPAKRTLSIIREIEKNRPSYFLMLRKRLLQKEVRI